jgi:hypothetical protein
MASILDNLPGVPMPISEISRQLREMWQGAQHPTSAAPSEFRASQLNLIIHFGDDTTATEADAIFSQAIAFTQRHPGRILVLAPSLAAAEEHSLSGKLFTQCYIGDSHREMCCCEAILLEYASHEPRSLFNQVSVWLEGDLPIYHWFHRVPVKAVKNKYLAFVKNAKRILFDSAIATDDFREIPTPDPWRIRDLADARMLPVKQSIGQVLSTFDIASILNGLQSIQIRALTEHLAHANQLKNWLLLCLRQADTPSNHPSLISISVEQKPDGTHAMDMEFRYSNPNTFRWSLCGNGTEAISQITIAQRSHTHHASFSQPEPASLLAEALFFGR